MHYTVLLAVVIFVEYAEVFVISCRVVNTGPWTEVEVTDSEWNKWNKWNSTKVLP
jgi:hypothetical protein